MRALPTAVVLRPLGLGDLLTGVPAIRAIRSAVPDYRLVLATTEALRPLVTAADRARVLEALEFVDAVVVFDEDTPAEVLDRLRPDVWAKGGDYAGADLPEAEVLRRWGGQAVVLPYLDGHSTTALVARSRV